MPLFFRISGALLLAAFLYLGISLQFVDAGEACSSERLAADRIYLPWYSLGALLLFAGVELHGGISAQLWSATRTAHISNHIPSNERYAILIFLITGLLLSG